MRSGARPRPRPAGGSDASGGSGRIVLVHGWAPPTRGGTSFVMARVLAHMDRATLDVWTRASQWRAVRRGSFVLPGRYRYFPRLRNLPDGPRALTVLVTTVNLALAAATGRIIGWAARRSGARCVVSVVDDGFSQVAGAVAARVAGLPHVLWVFDPWEENAYAASDRVAARWLERRIWRSASARIVHSEELAEHYRAKHGVRSHVLPIAIDDAIGGRDPDHARAPGEHREWEVLVAGAVYWAQAEALRRVASAVRRVDGARLTVLGDPRLQAKRIDARYEPATTAAALPARLGQADLLVVGLSFDTDHPHVIRTATPARLFESLASGVPVLVHAPAESHAARYVRRSDLATVVDEPDVDALVAAMESIRDDPRSRASRARRAREHALAHHAASVVRSAFDAILDAVIDTDSGAAPASVASTAESPAPDASRRPPTGAPGPRRVLVNAAAVRTGGGATFVVSQMGALARRAELELTVVAADEIAAQLELLAGLCVQRSPARSLARRLLWEHLVLAPRSRHYDVLYCAGNFALPLARAPQVVAMQNALLFGAAARRVRSRFARGARARLRLESALARVSVARATAVIAVSQSLRAAIEEDLGPRPSVRAIRSATPMLPPPRPQARAGPYVVSVAHDHPHKDWDALVRVFAESRDLPPLVAVGRFTAARRRRLERSAPGRVRFAGTVVDRAELADLYGAAACCVVHSWVEAFGLTALEALSCGTAVIASDIPAHREVCGDRVAYYDPADMTALAHIVRRAVAEARRGPAAERGDCAWTWDDNARDVAAVLVAADRSRRFHDGP